MLSYNQSSILVKKRKEPLQFSRRGFAAILTDFKPIRMLQRIPASLAKKLHRQVARTAMAPERAAEKIVRAIENNRRQIKIGLDARALGLVTKLAPGLLLRALARAWKSLVPSS